MVASNKIFKTLIWSNLDPADQLKAGNCRPEGAADLSACMTDLSDNNIIDTLNAKLSNTLTQMKNEYEEGETPDQKITKLVNYIKASKTDGGNLGDIDISKLSAFKPNHSLPAQRQEYELHSRKINMDSVLWGVVSLAFLYFTIKKIRTIGS